MRIGVFGGTFNPPHLGHLICAQEARLQLGLEQVLLMPAARPPHKPVPEDPGGEHRLALCRAALPDDETAIGVSDLEIVRGGTSFTVDTLEELHAREPNNELFLIIGGDMAASLPSWHEPERILALATPAVAARSGTSADTVRASLSSLPGGECAVCFEMPTIAISSSLIRRRAAAQEPVRYLVPDGVVAYIERHQLYRAAAPVAGR